MKKLFEKGGKLELFYPIYEMVETILVSKPDKTLKGSHVRDNIDLKRFMTIVIIAGIPAMLFGIYNAGLQHYASLGMQANLTDILLKGAFIFFPIIFVVYAAGGFWEMLFAVVRKHEINEGFLVTGFLIPLIVPPSIPLWQVAVATSFGLVVGKEVFGGTGMNFFNPALVARAFLFFAYPSGISGNEVWTAFGDKIVDTYTKATPLSIAVVNKGAAIVDGLAAKGYTLWNMFIGTIPGSIGETSTAAILVGAIILLATRIASWRVMLSVFAGGYAMGLFLNLVASSPSHIFALPAHYHLVMGGFAFGAVFMATDPVSAAGTNTGKLFYGFFIGVLAVIVRAVNPAYPEGMMLAILFMNMFAPLIDNIVILSNMKRRKKRAEA